MKRRIKIVPDPFVSNSIKLVGKLLNWDLPNPFRPGEFMGVEYPDPRAARSLDLDQLVVLTVIYSRDFAGVRPGADVDWLGLDAYRFYVMKRIENMSHICLCFQSGAQVGDDDKDLHREGDLPVQGPR